MSSYDPLNHVVHLQGGALQNSDLVRVVSNALRANTPSGIVIHVHGGRVSQKRGRAIAQGLHAPYAEAGAYPLFFVWETGDLEAPLNNLGEILSEVVKKLLYQKVRAKIEAKIDVSLAKMAGLKNASHEYFSIDEEQLAGELQMEIAADPEFVLAIEQARADYTAAKIASHHKAHSPHLHPADAAIVNERTADELFGTETSNKALVSGTWITLAWKIAKMAIRVRHRQRSGRGRYNYNGSWTAVVVEEVLRELYLDDVGRIGWWNPMKNDAKDSFKGNASGGVRFLHELRRQLANVAAVPRITLVGHSAGSIFLCEFLDRAAEILPNLTFDLILEAPAVTCERFAQAISVHDERIRKFRQFAMQDLDEAREMSFVFPGSLLYLVSNVFEHEVDEPLLGMERFFTRKNVYGELPEWAAIAACQAFFAKHGPDAVTWWTIGDVDQASRTGWGHGYFDDGPFILKKVTELIANPPPTG